MGKLWEVRNKQQDSISASWPSSFKRRGQLLNAQIYSPHKPFAGMNGKCPNTTIVKINTRISLRLRRKWSIIQTKKLSNLTVPKTVSLASASSCFVAVREQMNRYLTIHEQQVICKNQKCCKWYPGLPQKKRLDSGIWTRKNWSKKWDPGILTELLTAYRIDRVVVDFSPEA